MSIRQYGSFSWRESEGSGDSVELKTEVDKKRATWDKERIDMEEFLSMEHDDGQGPRRVAEKIRDVEELEERWEKAGDTVGNSLRRSVNLEFVIYHDLEHKNWLKEDERYDELMGEDEGFFLRTFPAAKYDDYHHGADIVCVANNSITGFKSVPFVLDATSDISEGGIAHHLNLPYKDVDNRHVRGYDGVRGLTSITFFEDRVQQSDEAYPKGSIPMVPRFVVGFDDDMAKQISGLESIERSKPVSPGADWSVSMSRYSDERFENWGDFTRKTPSEITDRLRELEQRANWIVVHELAVQTDKMLDELGKISARDGRVRRICEQLEALKKYFDEAKEIVDRETPAEMKRLCARDEVYKALMRELEAE